MESASTVRACAVQDMWDRHAIEQLLLVRPPTTAHKTAGALTAGVNATLASVATTAVKRALLAALERSGVTQIFTMECVSMERVCARRVNGRVNSVKLGHMKKPLGA